jgi:uncharacterized protein YjbI with pentapeptide repeats
MRAFMANPPSSPHPWSASAADDFENELPTGDPPTGFPANAAANAQRPSQHPSSTRFNYSESFTVDYNPDPDLQADNEDFVPYLPHSYAANGQGHAQPKSESMSPAKADESDSLAQGIAPERYQRQSSIDPIKVAQAPVSVIAVAGAIVIVVGFTLGSFWLTLAGSLVTFGLSLKLLLPTLQEAFGDLSPQQQALFIAVPGLLFGLIGLISTSGISRPIAKWGSGLRWDVISALGDFLGAIGQILIAVIAVYVAWRQYIISRDLTVQQNLITQQQTIDSYFQGISELVLDDEGLLEDWPQERVIAEARTAAILSSVDAGGKAKVLRFLSRSKLLTPLARDQRLGRPILDGMGGYAEDRLNGTRVIDVGVMLAASDISSTDLRWLDLSEANLIRANLTDCDLVRTNFARAILCDANLTNTDIMGARFFYGDLETATPRTRQDHPNYVTGEFTGAVVEGLDLTNVQRLSEVQRCYCCAWGGSKTRATVPGGCEGIPNRLGR